MLHLCSAAEETLEKAACRELREELAFDHSEILKLAKDEFIWQ